jgi:hypothetical protein
MPSMVAVREAALAALREDTQAWWTDMLTRNPDELDEGEVPAIADTEGLRRFLEGEVLPNNSEIIIDLNLAD